MRDIDVNAVAIIIVDDGVVGHRQRLDQARRLVIVISTQRDSDFKASITRVAATHIGDRVAGDPGGLFDQAVVVDVDVDVDAVAVPRRDQIVADLQILHQHALVRDVDLDIDLIVVVARDRVAADRHVLPDEPAVIAVVDIDFEMDAVVAVVRDRVVVDVERLQQRSVLDSVLHPQPVAVVVGDRVAGDVHRAVLVDQAVVGRDVDHRDAVVVGDVEIVPVRKSLEVERQSIEPVVVDQIVGDVQRLDQRLLRIDRAVIPVHYIEHRDARRIVLLNRVPRNRDRVVLVQDRIVPHYVRHDDAESGILDRVLQLAE